MAQNFPPVEKIFDDLDEFRNFCAYGWVDGFTSHVFDEANLYNDKSRVWQAFVNSKKKAKRFKFNRK